MTTNIKGPDKDPEGSKSGVGGQYTTGINPDPGGDTETDDVMPGTVRNPGPSSSAESATIGNKEYHPDENAPPPGPPPAVSDKEQMSGTDMNPSDPVTESSSDSAYEDGPDHTEGHKDRSNRPYGDHSPEGEGIKS